MTLNWYVLQVKPRHEKAVASVLIHKELETYVPIYKASRKWADRTKEVDLPLFPGYVFCRFDPQRRALLLNTSGIVQVVGVGKSPSAVEDTEVHNLRRLEETLLKREPHPYPAEGEEVIVCDGPLKGMTGLFLKVNRSSRLLLSVKLLQRSVAIEVSQDWVVPVNARDNVLARHSLDSLRAGASGAGACC